MTLNVRIETICTIHLVKYLIEINIYSISSIREFFSFSNAFDQNKIEWELNIMGESKIIHKIIRDYLTYTTHFWQKWK